ncbi:Repeat-companion domain protein OS=Isosphaera pallida (strain ATCC 43644 / DSM 9630 / IS1B) GN=Isop_0392 PE=4 SV=1 [Tuwongella immobilis]|uniref:Repeat-companion domain protein n=2 Tax=Tuwongella immobilis TaxID=692036 RepID=A0A6C2YIN4_9BACT|nr:Repeat-companion domain protein OS=Isosphaera pallida (strain ATCC 43644 / DSM 9630 / IS1B) GN=Isop_0392 PE=4 SV=1 [Tuwongella immobilis]VTR97707.1 Repeat-companion domain protein OS=Isosphaera pallida (strain ATCC 43644 / DSM 9630 / IS1B) GN=Isop_0392 PE=4 SV=1 [Tuwongella immobilis]
MPISMMPMDTPNDLANAIVANRQEDAPRLILADWLEEHHHAERAELIRVQCQLAAATARREFGAIPPLEARERELLRICDPTIRMHECPLVPGVIWGGMARGLLDVCRITNWRTFDAAFTREMAQFPGETLSIDTERDRSLDFADLAFWPPLDAMRELHIEGPLELLQLEALEDSPFLPQLQRLKWKQLQLTAQAVPVWNRWISKQRLDLSIQQTGLTAHFLGRLLGPLAAESLIALRFSQCRMHTQSLLMLASLPLMERLIALDLSDLRFTPSELETLLERIQLNNVEQLRLTNLMMSHEAFQLLTESSPLSLLQSCDLSGNPLSVPRVLTTLGQGRIPNLRRLTLNRLQVHEPVRLPDFSLIYPRLEVLHVGDCGFTTATIPILTQLEAPELTHLTLDGVRLNRSGMERLLAWLGRLPKLRSLSIRHAILTVDAAHALTPGTAPDWLNQVQILR